MDLGGARAVVVSGKGGTGKTTVAAALAMAEARKGRGVLLLELEGRQGAARLLGLRPATFEERRTPFGFSIASLGAREALIEYLGLFYGMGRLASSLLRSRAVEVAADAVPGMRDMMLTGKIYEVAEWRLGSRRGRDRPRYDLIVADAPPTGQIVPFLAAPATFAELIRVGRPHAQAERIDGFLKARTMVVLVTIPEELGVTEVLEARRGLEELGMRVGPVVLNRMLPPAVPRGTGAALERLRPAEARRLAEAAGLRLSDEAAATVLEVAAAHRRREKEQRTQARRLSGALAGAPVVTLPYVFSPSFGPAEVGTLGEVLDGRP